MIPVLLTILDPLVLVVVIGCALVRSEIKATVAIFASALFLLALGIFLQADEVRYIADVDHRLAEHFIGVVLWCFLARIVRRLILGRPRRRLALAGSPELPTALQPLPVRAALGAQDPATLVPMRPTLQPTVRPGMQQTVRPVVQPTVLVAPPGQADPPTSLLRPAPRPLPSAPALHSARPTPQAGRKRQIYSAPVGRIGTDIVDNEKELLAALDGTTTVMMMGDNPALPEMPDRPTLMDFFRLRFGDITYRHLLLSAKTALDAGQDEKIVIACLLHDIANGALVRSDHGYWGAQLIAPYVSDEVAWAVQYHQALRYFADEQAGYQYPASYLKFFGPDYVPPDYIRRDYDLARQHRWYGSARLVTIYDIYSFDQPIDFDPHIFTDIIGRNFRQPKEGLGFDNSPTAHMWRTMIWPNNFL